VKLPVINKTLLWLTVFSIAMAYLESAVVVYLREIAYPGGFAFPLKPIAPNIAFTEIIREAATIIMLLGAGYLGGRQFTGRFAGFLYCFAIWDLFYYVFLKAILNWPESLLTWDILFLIPVPWTGPVLGPVIASLTMIALAFVLWLKIEKEGHYNIRLKERTLLVLGSLLIILSFVWDYSAFLIYQYRMGAFSGFTDKEILQYLSLQYCPRHFPWGIFVLGELIIFAAIMPMLRKPFCGSKKRA
jgi:hypothetical protein